MPLTFPAKVLLLGEYTILNGSKALAIPYNAFQGKWSYEKNDSDDRRISRESLQSFLEHGSEKYINLAALKEDVKKGLWFDSSIPHGYGLGSSGAFIAAITSSYALKDGDRESLARLEDFFHGSSSGIDPYVSLVNKPLLIHSFNEVEVLTQKLNLQGFFLLNTGKARQTAPLVKTYQEKMKDPQFKQGCADVLSRDVNFAVQALISGQQSELFHHLWHISKFQWEFFPEMIPTSMRGLWTQGMESGDYVLKLCGAGGGGFVLGYSEKYTVEEMKMIIPSHQLLML